MDCGPCVRDMSVYCENLGQSIQVVSRSLRSRNSRSARAITIQMSCRAHEQAHGVDRPATRGPHKGVSPFFAPLSAAPRHRNRHERATSWAVPGAARTRLSVPPRLPAYPNDHNIADMHPYCYREKRYSNRVEGMSSKSEVIRRAVWCFRDDN